MDLKTISSSVYQTLAPVVYWAVLDGWEGAGGHGEEGVHRLVCLYGCLTFMGSPVHWCRQLRMQTQVLLKHGWKGLRPIWSW